jgi:hypothetical protein
MILMLLHVISWVGLTQFLYLPKDKLSMNHKTISIVCDLFDLTLILLKSILRMLMVIVNNAALPILV